MRDEEERASPSSIFSRRTIMNSKDIRTLYAFNAWANALFLEACAELDEERFLRPLGSSYESLRDTLAHIMAGEKIWVARWKGESPRSLLDPKEFPTFDSLRERWTEVERELDEFAQSVTDERLEEVVAYTNTRGELWSYPLGQMMQHVVNHSSYHRGQAATLLRQLGAKAPATDYLIYFDEKR